MIDIENTRKTIASGLKKYLSCPVIRGNQTADMPKYPYGSYNIINLTNENKGTYGEWEDGVYRKPFIATMSLAFHSDNYSEAVKLANKAHEWLEQVGTVYLNDNNVIIQSVGSITDRSNLLTTEYEYTYGFDCFIWLYDEIGAEQEEAGVIESFEVTPIIDK